jgi:class 3 adenylate cyclase
VDEQIKSLQEALRMKQAELNLIMSIDRIRDSVTNAGAMLSGIANLFTAHFNAEFCLVYLLDRESGDLELKAVSEKDGWLASLEAELLHTLAREAFQLDSIAVWTGPGDLPGSLRLDCPADLQIMGVPIILGHTERLGSILLGRSSPPFTPTEHQLMQTAEDQIDSAVIQGYANSRLEQQKKELDMIFRIDHIRDQGLSLTEMLNAVIQELTAGIEAELGFIMLYDLSGKKLETRASTHAAIHALPYFEKINTVVEEALEQGGLVWHEWLAEPLNSILCLPLILNEQVIGVLGVVNRYGPHGFTAADRRLLQALGSQIDTAIFERNEIRILRQVLGRSVDPRIMDRLLANPDKGFLKGELLELTVLYADIRGSTALAERTEPGPLVEFINDYLTNMTEVVLSFEGTIDKFVGDEVMALFGAPIPQAEHALLAVRVGLAMQARYAQLQVKWRTRGLAETAIGVGIATGEMIAGEMGGRQRTNYTVIGRPANLGSRICEVAKAGQVLVSPRTYELVRERVEAVPVPGQRFKGIPDDVTVYHILRVLE